MSQTTTGVYKHSGKLGNSLYLLPGVGIVAAAILSLVYVYAFFYVPEFIAGSFFFMIYIGILVPGYVLSLSAIFAKTARASKCRSGVFLTLSSLLVSVFALYSVWAIFIHAYISRFVEVFDPSLFEVFTYPRQVWNTILAINEVGWFEMSGNQVKGIELWFFWGIEAVVLSVGTFFLSLKLTKLNKSVFCEDCNQWCDTPHGPAILEIPTDAGALDLLTPENVDRLADLDWVADESDQYLRVNGWKCGNCQTTAAVKVEIGKIVTDKSGNASEKARDLTEVWLVETTAHDRVVRDRPDKDYEAAEDDDDVSETEEA